MQPLPRENRQKIPGVIATLIAGFELVTRHLWLIALPLIFDVFFWLGPRLSIEDLALEVAEVLRMEETLVELSEQLLEISTQINLFTALSVPIIGVPTLMNGPIPEETPISASVHQIGGTLEWLFIFIGFSLIGIIATALYLTLISKTIQGNNSWNGGELFRLVRAIFMGTYRLLGLGILFVFALVAITLPLLPIALVLGLLSSNLFIFVLLIGFSIVATYFCLTVPGIIYHGRPILPAVSQSFKIVHKNLLPTINLLVTLVLIGNGINLLWHMADDGSWITLVSLFGHAFIGTALLTTFFIYYRNQSEVQLKELL
jgi:hypothetical protein